MNPFCAPISPQFPSLSSPFPGPLHGPPHRGQGGPGGGGERAAGPGGVPHRHHQEGLHAPPPGGQVRQPQDGQTAAAEGRPCGRPGQEWSHAPARGCPLRPPGEPMA